MFGTLRISSISEPHRRDSTVDQLQSEEGEYRSNCGAADRHTCHYTLVAFEEMCYTHPPESWSTMPDQASYCSGKGPSTRFMPALAHTPWTRLSRTSLSVAVAAVNSSHAARGVNVHTRQGSGSTHTSTDKILNLTVDRYPIRECCCRGERR